MAAFAAFVSAVTTVVTIARRPHGSEDAGSRTPDEQTANTPFALTSTDFSTLYVTRVRGGDTDALQVLALLDGGVLMRTAGGEPDHDRPARGGFYAAVDRSAPVVLDMALNERIENSSYRELEDVAAAKRW
ncbi:hypothetical protein JF770_22280 [Mycobacterium intracellulare]|uniref:hypothetical protein n=1 Tax=Mycobacterium intracellulare TaxID=1767 RepID=UPI00109E9EBA|nr:hypothetical protein [Mycobacterium intracellulare]MCA2306293.1 hypothetical protein [Mycobacterium intracellulare]MCA2348346.1 hypothetical protein [Mycobacterium intracellulare]